MANPRPASSKTAVTSFLLFGTLALCTFDAMHADALARVVGGSSDRQSRPSPVIHNAAEWDPTIRSAMQYVTARSKVPLMAPTEQFQSEDNAYVSAQVTATRTEYSVTLQITNHPLRVNDPGITQPPNGALADYIGSFGGHEYSTRTQAEHALTNKPVVWRTTGAKRAVALGHGVHGFLYTSGIVEWHQGAWTLQVADGPPKGNVTLAKSVAAYMAGHHLSGERGLAMVDNAGDGEHTQLQWLSGNTIYTCGDYHNAEKAVERTLSMHSFP